MLGSNIILKTFEKNLTVAVKKMIVLFDSVTVKRNCVLQVAGRSAVRHLNHTCESGAGVFQGVFVLEAGVGLWGEDVFRSRRKNHALKQPEIIQIYGA